MLPAEGRRLFGTDGIRGRANVELTADLALAVGRGAGELVPGGQVLVGRDTRRSGEMLSGALQAGLHSVGVDTIDVGVLPTGGIAFLTADTRSSLGVVISASHNPSADNGIKLLGRKGSKLSDGEEDHIEQRIRGGSPWKVALDEGIGTSFRMAEADDRYLDHLRESMPYTLRGISIVLDCANGAAYRVAPELFRRLKAEVEVFAAEPDGTNINALCGATHPRYLAEHARGRLGFAFDGAGTGDGLLTAVRLLEVIASSGKELRELRKETITEYPQVLRNVHVADKGKLGDAALLWAAVRDAESRLKDEGRILVRASGTEPLVRVMVEAASATVAAEIADELVEISRGELGPAGED